MCMCIRCIMCISISSYFVFLVVLGVDDFFMLCYFSSATSRSGLSMFLLRHALLNIVFVAFSFLHLHPPQQVYLGGPPSFLAC
jgi:hypothetical protein